MQKYVNFSSLQEGLDRDQHWHLPESICHSSVQHFNDATKDRGGDMVPVIITAYEDKSFDFVLKTTPAAIMIKKLLESKKLLETRKISAVKSQLISYVKSLNTKCLT